MNNSLLVILGLLLIAVCSVGLASIIYIIGLLIWLIGIQIYYKFKLQITKNKKSQ